MVVSFYLTMALREVSIVLTCLLGWKAPRNSAQLGYPAQYTASATDEEINISFRPTPNYAALAEEAAGSEVGWPSVSTDPEAWMNGVRVRTVGKLRAALEDSARRQGKDGKPMRSEALM
jgi:hypothetical protein